MALFTVHIISTRNKGRTDYTLLIEKTENKLLNANTKEGKKQNRK